MLNERAGREKNYFQQFIAIGNVHYIMYIIKNILHPRPVFAVYIIHT